MKRTFIQFAKIAKCTTVMLLSCATVFTSCSKDDGEPSVDEILSEETTPITFTMHIFDNFLFDYTEGKYIGSDTLYSRNGGDEKNVELRHGKHELLWLWGLDKDTDAKQGIHFDPIKKTLENKDPRGEAASDVQFCQTNIEVTPYLMPVQKLTYENYATCMLVIRITDSSPLIQKPSFIDEYDYEPVVVGRITGIPLIRSVSLAGGEYTIEGDMNTEIIAVPAMNDYWEIIQGEQPWLEVTAVGERYLYTQGVKDIRTGNRLLCPANGLTEIHPVAEVYDTHGNLIPTTELPRITLLPGCVTCLTGPLFSGSSSDWSVSLQYYNDFDWNSLMIY